jgi:hypothetical protein
MVELLYPSQQPGLYHMRRTSLAKRPSSCGITTIRRNGSGPTAERNAGLLLRERHEPKNVVQSHSAGLRCAEVPASRHSCYMSSVPGSTVLIYAILLGKTAAMPCVNEPAINLLYPFSTSTAIITFHWIVRGLWRTPRMRRGRLESSSCSW